jgi:uncharacterized protein (DUF779 family)
MEKAAVDLLMGSDFVQWALDYAAQLDTPGTRDLRWDNIRPLRLNEIFSDETNALVVEDPNNRIYSLVDGTWLYNNNLRLFNESDPYRLSDKYTFIYGVTEKRAPGDKAQTAIGASIIPILLRDGKSPVGEVTSGHSQGASDGAVPIVSMAGAGIVNFRSVFVGNIDHEEYYSSTPDYGDKVAIQTFHSLGLEASRCNCATLKLEDPGDLEDITSLNINAQFAVDPKLDQAPGKRIKSAEALFYIGGTKEEFILGDLDVDDNGKLTGSFAKPDLGEGAHQLVVRATFMDGTKLESTPTLFKLKAVATLGDGSKVELMIEGEVMGGSLKGILAADRDPLYFNPNQKINNAIFRAERRPGSETVCDRKTSQLCGIWDMRFAYLVTENISKETEFSYLGVMDLTQQSNQVTGNLRYNVSPKFYEILATWGDNSSLAESIQSNHSRLTFTISGMVASGSVPLP